MKWKNTAFTICLILLFALGVYYSYKQFYPSIINPIIKNQQSINFNQISDGIYFQSNNNFYLANTDTSFNRLFLPDKIQIDKNDEALAQTQTTPKTITTSNGKFYLKTEEINSQKTVNLYFIDNQNQKNQTITSLIYPEEITNFSLSQDNKHIILEITNNAIKTSNISICKPDGTNLTQLTTDGISYFPIFSPDNTRIAFWRKNQGIYTTNINQNNFIKILNFKAKIDQIFVWRLNEPNES